MSKHNAQLFEFLAQYGWQWERDEPLVVGKRDVTRAWFRKGNDVRLLKDALWQVQMDLGAPAKSSGEYYYEEPPELTEDQIEQLRLEGTI